MLFVFMLMNPSIPGFRPPEGIVQVDGVAYRMTVVDLPHCEKPIGSSALPASAESGDFSFSMRIEHCYSPGGLSLNGSCTPAGGASSFFNLSSLQVPDEQGWISWFSPDARAAVRWDGAYRAQVLSMVD